MHQKYDSLSTAGQRLARIPRFGRLIAKLPESRFSLLSNEAATYWELFTYLSATDQEDATGLLDSGLRRGGRKLGWHDQASEFPERDVIQTRRWQVGLAMYFLGAVAFEMFLGEAGDGKQPPRFVIEGELDVFLKRVFKRVREGGGYLDSDDEPLPPKNCPKDWKQLRQLNSHGLQYNLFSDARERILFADISTQAFFAAYWVARWSDKHDRQQVRRWFPDPLVFNDRKALAKQEPYREFWRFLCDMPRIECQSQALTACRIKKLQVLFKPLYDGSWRDPQNRPIRSTELIYRSWDWMQGTAAQAAYQSEFAALVAAKHPVAMGLLYTESGDSAFVQLADPANPRDKWDTGAFMMGAPEGEDSDWDGRGSNQENPLHRVRLSPFRLHRYCVTNAAYELFDPRHKDHRAFTEEADIAEHPVVHVSWYDAWCFSRWGDRFVLTFNGQRREYRLELPTEAQWEYACRCGETTPFTWHDRKRGNQIRSGDCNFGCNYPWPNHGKVKQNDKYLKRTIRVDGCDPELSVPANPWGLHQLHGNVWEWCQDWFSADYYSASPEVDPLSLLSDLSRTLRGGSWIFYGVCCRSGARYWYDPSDRGGNGCSGFRLAAVLVNP